MRLSQLFLWPASLFIVTALGETTSLPQAGNISLGGYLLQWSKISSTPMPSLNALTAEVTITTETINTTTPFMSPYTKLTTCNNGVEPTLPVTTDRSYNQSLPWNRTSPIATQTPTTVNATTWSNASAQPSASQFVYWGSSKRSTHVESSLVGLCCFLSTFAVM